LGAGAGSGESIAIDPPLVRGRLSAGPATIGSKLKGRTKATMALHACDNTEHVGPEAVGASVATAAPADLRGCG
jgi:CRISPR/Cas system CMR subunit Cmr4 (Cas7 group RAMP superfamily)